MDLADLIAEVKTLRARIKELEDQGGGDAKVKALEAKIEGLEKKQKEFTKPLEDSDFASWD